MTQPLLSSDIRSLLDSCIETIEALDVLLVLQQEPGRRFRVVDLAKQLGVDVERIVLSLTSLSWHGLVRSDSEDGIQLEPLSALAREGFAELVVLAQTHRAAVLEHLEHRTLTPRGVHHEVPPSGPVPRHRGGRGPA